MTKMAEVNLCDDGSLRPICFQNDTNSAYLCESRSSFTSDGVMASKERTMAMTVTN